MKNLIWIGLALLVWGLLVVGYANQQKAEIGRLQQQLATCQATHRR